jgi:hypothetical protein
MTRARRTPKRRKLPILLPTCKCRSRIGISTTLSSRRCHDTYRYVCVIVAHEPIAAHYFTHCQPQQGEENFRRRLRIHSDDDDDKPLPAAIEYQIDTTTLPPSVLLPRTKDGKNVATPALLQLAPGARESELSGGGVRSGVISHACFTRHADKLQRSRMLLDAGEAGLEALSPDPLVLQHRPPLSHPLASGSVDWLPPTLCALSNTVQSMGHCTATVTPQ